VQLAAIEACTQLKVIHAIPALIDMLDSAQPRLRQKAHGALVQLTNNDYGESKEKWRRAMSVAPVERSP
jgi:HEAT repeat protein